MTKNALKTVKDFLKLGRFLEGGETIEDGDICVDTLVHPNFCFVTTSPGFMVSSAHQYLYFRLNPLVKKKIKYRLLSSTEPVRNGDQWYKKSTRSWNVVFYARTISKNRNGDGWWSKIRFRRRIKN